MYIEQSILAEVTYVSEFEVIQQIHQFCHPPNSPFMWFDPFPICDKLAIV